MTDVKKVAIIGFGNRAKRYLLDIRESVGEKILITAVADTDVKGAAERLANEGCKAKVYSTPQELAEAEKGLDAFIITTPDNCHLESFRTIAHLNKPLLMEKPLEGTAEKFEILAKELKKYKAPVLVGHCMRHTPILQKAKQLIDQGWVGRVTSMRFVQNCHYGDVFFRGWHRRRDAITSLFVEKATHDFDIMHMLNGDNYASSVFAFSRRYAFGGDKPDDLKCSSCSETVSCPESLLNVSSMIHGNKNANLLERGGRNKCVWAKEIDICDDEMCMVEFANGVQGSYIETFYTPYSYKGRFYTIIGDEGVMDIDVGHFEGEISVYPRYGTKNDRMSYKFDYLGRNHYNGDAYLVRNFLGVLEGKEKPLTTVEAAIAAEALGLAAAKSSETRKLEKIIL